MSLFKKRKKLWIVLLILIVVATVSFLAFRKREKVAEVQTGKVKRQKLVSVVSASGYIQPQKKVEISASIPGKVMRLAVKEGDQAKKGDFLLQIDPFPYEAALENSQAALNGSRAELESARTNLKQAEQTYNRKKRMREQDGLISEEEYERTLTEYEVARARVQTATHQMEQAAANVRRSQDDLSKTAVTAPMSGTIVRLSVEEGEVAVIGTMNNPGTVLMTIADLSVMEAELEVDEADIGSLLLGQQGAVTVDAFPGKKFSGKVTEIGNSPIQKGTGTNQEATDFKVTITLNSPDVNLRPGLTCDGEIITAVRESCLTVPIQSLVIRDITKGDKGKDLPKEEKEKEGLFLKQGEKAVFRTVKTGIMGEMNIEITQGMKEGEEIVTGTYQTLRELKDGDKIRIAKEEKKEKE